MNTEVRRQYLREGFSSLIAIGVVRERFCNGFYIDTKLRGSLEFNDLNHTIELAHVTWMIHIACYIFTDNREINECLGLANNICIQEKYYSLKISKRIMQSRGVMFLFLYQEHRWCRSILIIRICFDSIWELRYKFTKLAVRNSIIWFVVGKL